jgi:sulfur carrier protein
VSPATETLLITVNDQPLELAAPATLLGIMADMGLSERRGVAAAVNGQVVPRSAWASRALAQSDRVLVIRATQGG